MHLHSTCSKIVSYFEQVHKKKLGIFNYHSISINVLKQAGVQYKIKSQ